MSASPVRLLAVSLAALGLTLGVGPRRTEAGDGSIRPVRFVFVGDIMLDRDPGKFLRDGGDPFAGVAALLDGADFTVGNLECVVATGGKRADKFFTFRADPKAVPLLARHFDAVSLANNHTGDFGHDALIETMDRLREGGVRYFGAGRNSTEAHQPCIVVVNGLRVALLGYNEFRPRTFEAGPTTPGCAWSVDEQVVADIKAERPLADVVITFMHWGQEYKFPPNDRQKALARTMIDAGADVVIGNHPHVVEGAEYYKGKLVVYSLGNFVFDEYKDDPPILKEERRIGWALRLSLDRTGLVKWDTVVTRTDDDGIPQVLPSETGPSGKAGSEVISAGKTR